jgi:hypothetical protein
LSDQYERAALNEDSLRRPIRLALLRGDPSGASPVRSTTILRRLLADPDAALVAMARYRTGEVILRALATLQQASTVTKLCSKKRFATLRALFEDGRGVALQYSLLLATAVTAQMPIGYRRF